MAYKSLIGSLIDYSSFLVNIISESHVNILQIVQNRAIRSIFKLRFDSSTSELCSKSGMVPVKNRLIRLNKSYIDKRFLSNDWIRQLVEEYLGARNSLRGGRCPLEVFAD